MARRIVVRGRVQGVFFRDSCARQARSAGVSGWIRNRADGTVEGWLEGPPLAVEKLLAWCRHGPGRADVTDVEAGAVEPAGLERFRIE